MLKLPVLVSHYIEHKEHNSNMTVYGYLVHHYEGHEKDEDWDTDMKLPFMQHSDLLQVLVAPPLPPVKLPKGPWVTIYNPNICFFREQFVPSSPAGSIWQPPQHC